MVGEHAKEARREKSKEERPLMTSLSSEQADKEVAALEGREPLVVLH